MRKLIIAAAAALAMFGIGVAPASASTTKAQFTASCSGGYFNLVPTNYMTMASSYENDGGGVYQAITNFAPTVDNLCWLNDGYYGYAEIVDVTVSDAVGGNYCLTYNASDFVPIQGCYGAVSQQWDGYDQANCQSYGCEWMFGNDYTDQHSGGSTWTLNYNPWPNTFLDMTAGGTASGLPWVVYV